MTAISHHKRKDLMIEARFLPDSIDQAERLRILIRSAIENREVDGLTERYAEATANAIIGWLIGKRQGVDGLSAPTRSQYRKVLHALEDRAPRDPEGGRVRHPGIAWVTAGSGALAAAGVATGDPMVAAFAMAGAVLLPIIYEDQPEQMAA